MQRLWLPGRCTVAGRSGSRLPSARTRSAAGPPCGNETSTLCLVHLVTLAHATLRRASIAGNRRPCIVRRRGTLPRRRSPSVPARVSVAVRQCTHQRTNEHRSIRAYTYLADPRWESLPPPAKNAMATGRRPCCSQRGSWQVESASQLRGQLLEVAMMIR